MSSSDALPGIHPTEGHLTKTILTKTPPTEARQAAVCTLARRNLIDFAILTHRAYSPGWHHRLVAEHLEKVARGEIDRLMVLMPPRHGKSELGSKCFPPWYLGNFPERKVIATSYAMELAQEFGRACRNTATDTLYIRRCFQGWNWRGIRRRPKGGT